MQFTMIAYDLMQDENLKASEFKVHTYLLRKYNKNLKYAFPSMETMAEKLNISVSTVKRAIKKLAQIGYITVGKRKGRAGNYNIYTNLKYLIEPKKKTEVVEDIDPVEEDAVEEVNTSKKSEEVKVSKIDNHDNVRLARSVTNIDKSKFAKTVLTLAKEELVREAIRNFKKKKGKNATFLVQLLIDEYHKAGVEFSSGMFNLLKSGLKGAFIAQPL